MGLFDAILIKDNHIAIAGGVAQAIKAAKKRNNSIEIECDTLEQVDAALRAKASTAFCSTTWTTIPCARPWRGPAASSSKPPAM